MSLASCPKCLLELCFIWDSLPSSSSFCRAWSSPILDHEWRVPMIPLADCLVSAAWCQRSVVSSLMSVVWCQQPGVNSLVSAVWCQRSGVSGLESAVWCQRSGGSNLMSAICCYLRRRNLCAIFTKAGYIELNLLPNTCSTTLTIEAS
jgi:hypothetical protein